MFPGSWLIHAENEKPASPTRATLEPGTVMDALSKRRALVVVDGLPTTVVTPTLKVPNVANGIAAGDVEPYGQVPLQTASMQFGAREAVASVVNSQKFSTVSPPPHSEEAMTGLYVATLVNGG